MEPRYYQSESVDATFNYFAQGGRGNPVNALPTGTGKSFIIALFIQKAMFNYPNTRVMMLTHVKELIANNFETLLKIWPTAPAGIYSAGLRRRDTHCPITYAGIGSVAKRAAEFGHIDLILVDECDLVSPKEGTMYRIFFNALLEINPNMKIIGYTATPWRMGVGSITEGGLFTDICYDCTTMDSFNRLIAEGFLAPLVPKRMQQTLDVSGVRTQGGEFVLKDLQQAVDKEEITYAALKETMEHGADRKHWLIFATGVEHCDHIVEMLDSMGISAVAVHSRMTDKERDEAIRKFKSGEVRAAVNNNILTVGFDFPAIDLIAVIRPTKSARLWVQLLGRGTRPSPGKENCLVLDFAQNTRRLGPINDPVLPTKRGKKGGVAPVRCCEDCGTYSHATIKICPECGLVFPVHVHIKTHASEDQLIVGSHPVLENFAVQCVTYAKHVPRTDKPPSLKVTYICGLRTFSEWVCLEHSGFARKKARDWWMERDMELTDETEVTHDIDEALEITNSLLYPRTISVWVNKKYPEIMSYDFRGAEAVSPDSTVDIPF